MDKSRRARRACARVLTNMVRERGDEKNPRRLARASDAVLVNNGFLEDSVTRSQAFCYSRARKMRSPCKQQEKNRERGPQAICVRSRELALLWQIYSGRRSLQIHFRQCGHRCGGSRAKSSRMAWRTAGKVG